MFRAENSLRRPAITATAVDNKTYLADFDAALWHMEGYLVGHILATKLW
jgi:hypothetical protein